MNPQAAFRRLESSPDSSVQPLYLCYCPPDKDAEGSTLSLQPSFPLAVIFHYDSALLLVLSDAVSWLENKWFHHCINTTLELSHGSSWGVRGHREKVYGKSRSWREREREKDYTQWSSVRVRAERKKHSLKESLLLNKNRCLRFLFFICCPN